MSLISSPLRVPFLLLVVFLFSTPLAAQCTAPGFNVAKRMFPVNYAGAPVFAGDLNGDGKADAVFQLTPTNSITNITVFLGDGTGGFGAPALYQTTPTYGVLFGDINGDNRPDMLTVQNPNLPSKVWLNNGAGVFNSPTTFQNTIFGPQLLADFNGDGKADLITGGTPVQLRIGDGAGNFAIIGITITPPNQYGPVDFVTGDFDGNGALDLAISYLGPSNATKLIIAYNDGSGNLLAGTPIDTGSFMAYHVAADFNGDGKADLAGSNPQFQGVPPVISILLSNGSGGFTQTNYPVANGTPRALQKGDFNGDGKVDVALEVSSAGNQSRGYGSILFGNGAGGFTLQGVGKPGLNLDVSADFNNDGITDALSWTIGNFVGPYAPVRTLLGTCARKSPTNLIDYDGDGLTDLAVWRPSTAHWMVQNSGPGTLQDIPWGGAGDMPVPGDYDGDGLADFGVFRPNEGNWYILFSRDHSFLAVHWGANGDKPLPGDYDGDGRVDLCIYRPLEGSWYYLRSSDATVRGFQFGISEDVPVPSDYDGDGATDISVFRPSAGIWYLLRSSNLSFSATVFGLSTDKVVPGDYDGDGRSDIAVYRPSQAVWYILRSFDGTLVSIPYGLASDLPTPGDYSGRDGIVEIAVRRPSNGAFYVYPNSTAQALGTSTDQPVVTTNPTQ